MLSKETMTIVAELGQQSLLNAVRMLQEQRYIPNEIQTILKLTYEETTRLCRQADYGMHKRKNKFGIFTHHKRIAAVAGRYNGHERWSWIRCTRCNGYLDENRFGSDGETQEDIERLVQEHQCKKEKGEQEK